MINNLKLPQQSDGAFTLDGTGTGENGLYDTVWKFSYYILIESGARTYCPPIVLVPIQVPVPVPLSVNKLEDIFYKCTQMHLN